MEEFAELMGKCGMIMRDPQTQKHKLKLYAEADGQLKGDGLCDYIKVRSEIGFERVNDLLCKCNSLVRMFRTNMTSQFLF